MQKYQVIARKYRPQNFKDVVGQSTIVTTLKNALKFQKIAHAYLFCGGRGSGKTTLARLFAKSLNCQNLQENFEPCNHCSSCLEITSGQSLDVMEIDGASNRGIDDIRQINENVGYVPSHGKFKIYIIDEVHMLTKEAFNALLKTLEEPPAQAKFFFATTEPHKILPTIISRCQRFDLQRIDIPLIVGKLKQIAVDLQRDVCDDALYKIAELSDGSLRDAQSLFDQILCFIDGRIEQEAVRQVFGLVPQEHFFQLDQAFEEGNFAFAFNLIDYLYKAGKDLGHFMTQLIDHFRQIAICKTQGPQNLQGSSSAKYLQQSKLYTQSQSLYILEYLIQSETQLQKSLCPRVFVENSLLHILRSKNKIPVEILIKRLLELESGIKQSQDVISDRFSDSVSQQDLKTNIAANSPALPLEEKKDPFVPFTPNVMPPPLFIEQPPEVLSITTSLKKTSLIEKPQDEILKTKSNICSENTHLIDNLFLPPTQELSEEKAKNQIEELKQEKLENIAEISSEETKNPSEMDSKTSNIKIAENLLTENSSPQKKQFLESLEPLLEQNAATVTNNLDFNSEFHKAVQTDLFEPLPSLNPPQEQTEQKSNLIQTPVASVKTQPTIKEDKTAQATKPQSHYDTIMRFAAVELEGSLKL